VLVDVTAVPREPVGAGVYTLRLVAALAAAGAVDLQLATRRDDGSRWRSLAPRADVHAVAPNRRPARLLWEQLAAPRLASELGVDVWHGPHYTLPWRVPVASVVTVHDLTFFDHPEWHERTKVAFFRRAIPAAVRRADAVIAVSAYTAAGVRERFGSGPGSGKTPVVVAAHGVDHGRFDTRVDPLDDRRLRGIGVVRPYLAFVGLLEPRKDVPSLVAAFSRLSRARPDLRLVIAGGDGWGTDAVRDAVAASGVASRIARTGYLEDAVVPALLRNAEVVVYPSREEGFGLPALEALACGAALVSTYGSAIEEVVDDAAVLVPPGDVDALASAVEWLLSDGAARDALRRAAPARARPYTWAESARRHVEAYEQARDRWEER
jgi:glycosyltransferase involved in cell wall biosynthesis